MSEDGLRASNENMDLLMSRLEKLSISIGRLNPAAAATPDEGDKNGSRAVFNGLKEEVGRLDYYL